MSPKAANVRFRLRVILRRSGLLCESLPGFRVGYVSGDGSPHQLPLADARAVRFEVMTPTAAVRRTERAAALINPMCEEAARIAGGLRG